MGARVSKKAEGLFSKDLTKILRKTLKNHGEFTPQNDFKS
jgi:hypothetical protein